MNLQATQARFAAALDALVAQVRHDKAILAAILCGSLSHDVVWEKSDIDLVLVTLDDRKIAASDLPLYADGVNVHANLVPRAEFRKMAEGAIRNSFIHSLLAKGRLLYTHDDTIAQLFSRLSEIGSRDTARGDLEYTALWILYAATPLAEVEVISRRLLADREVIPQALGLNPAFFKIIYSDLLNTPKTRVAVEAALDAVDRYLADRTTSLFAPILDHLRDVGDVRSSRDLEDHFTRHLNVSGVVTACEYLADRGLIGKASAPARLTKRSNVDVEELAFFHLGGPGDGDA
jgi:predicted nucleotidyltransferase